MLALIALALLASPPDIPPPPVLAPELPPEFICAVRHQSPLGEIGAQQSISRSGEPNEPLFSWANPLGDSGIMLQASWSAAPSDYSLIQLSYNREQPGRSYRLRVQRQPLAPGQTEMSLEAALMPSIHGFVLTWAEWGPLIGALTGASDPRFLVLDDTGAVVANETVDPTAFLRARTMAEALRPELVPMVADYRSRCTYYPGGSVSIPSE